MINRVRLKSYIELSRYSFFLKHIENGTEISHKAFAAIMLNHETVVSVRIKDESKIKFCGTVYKCAFSKKSVHSKKNDTENFFLFI